jgi:CBS domain-containing protein
MMQLKDVLKNKGGQPVTVSKTSTVAFAIQTMNTHRVGAVIVTDTDAPQGILTERDILHLCAEGQTHFDALSVQDCMTTDITIGHLHDLVGNVLAIMTAKRFRHMPVVENDKLVGVVSIGDLVKAKLEETAIEAQALRDYITT